VNSKDHIVSKKQHYKCRAGLMHCKLISWWYIIKIIRCNSEENLILGGEFDPHSTQLLVQSYLLVTRCPPLTATCNKVAQHSQWI